MTNFDTPTDFTEKQNIDGYLIEYLNLMEICQGGPVVGNIRINKKNIMPENKFGSPLIVFEGFLFIPIYVKKFFKTGFKLCKINLANLSIIEMSNLKDLIYIDKIENNKLYYFEDLTKMKRYFLDIKELMK